MRPLARTPHRMVRNDVDDDVVGPRRVTFESDTIGGISVGGWGCELSRWNGSREQDGGTDTTLHTRSCATGQRTASSAGGSRPEATYAGETRRGEEGCEFKYAQKQKQNGGACAAKRNVSMIKRTIRERPGRLALGYSLTPIAPLLHLETLIIRALVPGHSVNTAKGFLDTLTLPALRRSSGDPCVPYRQAWPIVAFSCGRQLPLKDMFDRRRDYSKKDVGDGEDHWDDEELICDEE
ncbi:hypothetical protein B0H13DRAFT_1872979 [Mycena leptocephala]|nr:hypothetical protein B0H13DRAFT_1872979 [Mycena leptocephala]